MVQAIETVYNGFRFRSRLEARWAVFFDTLGIAYQYEPEGFEFDGERYLPDFYLPKQEWWCEVKAIMQPADVNKITSLATVITPRPVLFLTGNNDFLGGSALVYRPDDKMFSLSPFRWGKCIYCGWIGMRLLAFPDGPFYDRCVSDSCYNLDMALSRKGLEVDHLLIAKARDAARQARFEFGQVGAPSQWAS